MHRAHHELGTAEAVEMFQALDDTTSEVRIAPSLVFCKARLALSASIRRPE
jgi:hypothetical protein